AATSRSRPVIGAVARTEAATVRGLGSVFRMLPPQVRLALLVLGLLAAMVGCSAAWIDQQSYVPSPNICAPTQVQRTDCQHVNRVPAQSVPTPAGWQR
ncbi:hypothetical protein, partial [Nocardia sp. NPDC051463]|uniref:hypothetical protein n=1 Tax=Nocardia sp. NPDC051463 TaxID=3154845 RepID=UPI00344EBC5D